MKPIKRARKRLEAIAERERADERIDPRDRTAWSVPDAVAPRAVVLLHGITNGPLQYEALLPLLAARGWAVIVPRFPYHGYRDRMSGALGAIRFEDFAATALEAVEIAALAGERVAVAGISVGAAIAGWLAARVAFDHALAIAPFCGVRFLPGAANDGFGALLRALPNAELWWDPRRKEGQQPWHAYPRFPTHGLGVALAFGTTLAAAIPGGPHARAVTLALNAREPTINNAHAERRFAALCALGVGVRVETWRGLPPIHDTIEPEIPQARIDLSYPLIVEALERA